MGKVSVGGILAVALLLAMGAEVTGYAESYSELEVLTGSVDCTDNNPMRELRESKTLDDEWEEEYEEFMERWMRLVEQLMEFLEEIIEELEELAEKGIEKWLEEKIGERVEEAKESIEERIEEIDRSIDEFLEGIRDWFSELFTDEDHEELDGYVLDVPYVYQGETEWCMVASVTMLLRYYGKDAAIWEEAEELGFRNDVISAWVQTIAEAFFGKVEGQLLKGKYHYEDEDIQAKYWIHSDSEDFFDYIRERIIDEQPIMLMSHQQGHVVVIVGYEISHNGEKYIYVHDPSGDITRKHFNSQTPHKHVRVGWDDFHNLLEGKPTKTLVIKDKKDPKKVTIQLGGSSIKFKFRKLYYRTIWGEDITLESEFEYANLFMDEGLIWQITEGGYVREDRFYRIYWNTFNDVVGWDVTNCKFECPLFLTSIDGDKYKVRVYFEDDNGFHYLKKEIEDFEIRQDESKLDLEFDIGTLSAGEYSLVIEILKGNDPDPVTQVTLPKIKIIGMRNAASYEAEQLVVENQNLRSSQLRICIRNPGTHTAVITEVYRNGKLVATVNEILQGNSVTCIELPGTYYPGDEVMLVTQGGIQIKFKVK